MSFVRQRAPGLFIDGSVVTGAEFEYWDAAIASAFDPVGGGAYAPEANVDIGGAPGVEWTFDLPVNFNDATTFYQPAFFDESVTFDGPVNFYYPVAFSDDVSFSDPVTFSDITTFDGEVTHNGFVTFNNETTFNANVNVASGAFCNFDGAYFDDDVAFGGTVSFTASGKVAWKSKTIAVTGDQSVSAVSYDTVHIPDGLMGNGDNITIDDTGATNGMRMHFKTFDNANVVYIRTPGGSVIGTGLFVGVNGASWLTTERIGGTWTLIAAGRDSYT